MTSIRRFFRLGYANDTALENMLKTGTAVCSNPDFALSASPGDGIVLADFDEAVEAARVRAIGIVARAANHGQPPGVQWAKTSLNLYPTQQGMRFWRQTKPFFIFAKAVAARYRLQELFGRTFAALPASDAVPAGQRAAPQQSADATSSTTLHNRFDPGGYVYLIRSPYGYKIGKTKRMKERSQIFSVKLPFDIEIVHYAWFADYSRAENLLHQRYGNKRLNGEWFNLSPAEVEEIKRFKIS